MDNYNTKRKGVEVKIVETGETFNSIRACANKLHADVSQVGQVCRGNNGLKTVHGYHVVPVKNRIDILDSAKGEYRGRPGVRIKIRETGETFNSISDCAKAINGSAGAIHDAAHNNRNRVTHKGLHFDILE